jgi:hypothetical protein
MICSILSPSTVFCSDASGKRTLCIQLKFHTVCLAPSNNYNLIIRLSVNRLDNQFYQVLGSFSRLTTESKLKINYKKIVHLVPFIDSVVLIYTRLIF